MASVSGETLTDCTARAGPKNAIKPAMRTTTPAKPRQPRAVPAWARRRSLRLSSVKRSPRQSRTRVALDEPEQDVVAPGPVDPEEPSRVALAPEAVALEQRDRGRIFRDAGRLDPMQPEPGHGELDRRRDRARHAALARMRRPHPVAERPALRDPAPDAAHRDSAQEFVREAVEDEERIGLVARHVVVLAPQAPAKRRAGQIVVRPRRLPGLEKGAAQRPQPRPGRIIRRRRRPQINAVAAHQRLRANGARQAEQRHQTPLSARAIFAWPGTLPAAPIAATAGADLSMAAPVLRTSSTVTASTRASISSNESGRP